MHRFFLEMRASDYLDAPPEPPKHCTYESDVGACPTRKEGQRRAQAGRPFRPEASNPFWEDGDGRFRLPSDLL